MIILSHRGWWKDPNEKNQQNAFSRSFDAGFGTETDLRDSSGRIVISHDMPRGGELAFEELLQIMAGRNLPLALNIKADGLHVEIERLLKRYNHTNYFTFDMSIPEAVRQIESGIQVFTGMSDVLPEPVLFEQAKGVWLDAFKGEWYKTSLVDALVEQKKSVCVVSSELHGRDYRPQWEKLAQCVSVNCSNLMLCTDYPDKAQEYFK